jgi:hypothetical protein
MPQAAHNGLGMMHNTPCETDLVAVPVTPRELRACRPHVRVFQECVGLHRTRRVGAGMR